MKAMMRQTYGSPDVLTVTEIDTPTPKPDEVLVRVQATSINAADWRMLRADPFLARLDSGLITPRNKILGSDVAGQVEAVGKDVRRFGVGDAVFGNLFERRGGAFAEFVAVPERLLLTKPTRLTFEQAAAVPMAAVTALCGLQRHGRIGRGQQVLIYGASGGVGTFAIQLARAFGAEVTAVVSARNLEQARSLGADHVLDRAAVDVTKTGRRYDLILAVNGYQPIWMYKQALCPDGHYVMAGGSGAQMFQAMVLGPLMSRQGGSQLGVLSTRLNVQDLEDVKRLIEEGGVRPIIDRAYSFDEIPEAIRYMETGRARAKVVVAVGPRSASC